MDTKSIFNMVGFSLLLLGGASGVTLFLRTAFGDGKDSDARKSTLWGLFLIGVCVGLVLAQLPVFGVQTTLNRGGN